MKTPIITAIALALAGCSTPPAPAPKPATPATALNFARTECGRVWAVRNYGHKITVECIIGPSIPLR